MDIQIFVNRRKELGLSQIELSEGICTQATLSRFENHGQIPSMKILTLLCKKLHMDVGELFPSVAIKDSVINKKLDKIEFHIVNMEYEEAEELIHSLNAAHLTTQQLWRYLYLKGFTQTLLEKESTDSFFYFNQLLADHSDVDNKYIFLAYTGIGLIYMNQGDYDKAEYFFEKAIHQIDNHTIESIEDVCRVLTVLYYGGTFYAKIKEYDTSDVLLRRGITICSENHVTYYLARIKYLQAENAFVNDASSEEVKELMRDAAAFARVNKNTVLLEKIKVFKELVAKGE